MSNIKKIIKNLIPKKNDKQVAPQSYSAKKLGIDTRKLPESVISTLDTLNDAGFEVYLVGGCVRDLLLGMRPKDFDIATNATPEQIIKIYRRSRIIGQRFKIVHAYYKRECFEITTFRRPPSKRFIDSKTGRIVSDNEYGTIVDDAKRRDFTCNALYLNIHKDEVIDFFDGIKSIEKKELIVIGDIAKRFEEDPVRMLRMVRFQAKLDFTISDEIYDQIGVTRHLLNEISPGRRFDEVIKLFCHGDAQFTLELLDDYDLLSCLFASDAVDHYEQHPDLLDIVTRNTDDRVRDNKPVIAAFLFSAILWPVFFKQYNQRSPQGKDINSAFSSACEYAIAQQVNKTSMLRRVSITIREIWWLQFILEKTHTLKTLKLIEQPKFRAAYDFYLIRAEIGEADPEIAKFWTELQETAPSHRRQYVIGQMPANQQKRHRQRSSK